MHSVYENKFNTKFILARSLIIRDFLYENIFHHNRHIALIFNILFVRMKTTSFTISIYPQLCGVHSRFPQDMLLVIGYK